MRSAIVGALLGATLAIPATAQEMGDVAAGEGEFRKCRACHMIQDSEGTDIVRGGATGPNLWNIVGSGIAAEEGYRYGDGLIASAEANPDMVWTPEELVAYVTDPTAWVKEKSGDDSARSKMTFKLNRNQEDLVAYLVSVSPDAPAE
ncbi:cytochrome C [Paracoccus liaowanqingii]|uniref:Cytochrome C n=1 Tax=Paracoccus liaowanqingii TaxID=2560053 RepID=A0A4V1BJ81_9RHOB|nr:cytochrome C [Paracoccus liaowanqingii]QBX35372.1 cytochrome C [Paracoccus liaowanqingii]TGN55595.1 cytochrome C [Paracoccus liaowanqingii]